MKMMKIFLAAALACVAFVGCSEDAIEVYSGVPSMNVGVMKSETLVDTTLLVAYGFVNDTYTDLKVKLYLSGTAVDHDRTVDLEFDGDAVEETDFTMDRAATLKAGQIETVVPCRIKRDASLNGKSRNLIIRIKANTDFQASVMNYTRINFSDAVPVDWMNVQYNYGTYAMGACSKVKYLFLYDVMGIYDFTGYSWSFAVEVGKYMTTKVQEYNTDPAAFETKYGITHGKYGPAPMKDENGAEVKYK